MRSDVNMALDFDDILGGEPEEMPSAGTGRNFRALNRQFVYELDRGVDRAWLAQAFGMRQADVTKRLVGCPVLRMKGSAKIYDFKTACAYVVTPKFDIAKYLDGLDPKHLPEQLRSEYWSSRLKEQKARQLGGDLWHSEDVQAAFGEMFKLIKDVVKLWTDSIDEETTGLSDPQREKLDDLTADLLVQIGDTITAYADGKRTEPQSAEFDEVIL